MTTVINIAKDFSDVPAGRYRADGAFSGEVFREDVLLPALQRDAKVNVQLDGVEGYSSAFLEEAFGGLVRLGRISATALKNQLTLESKDRALLEEVWDYINRAEAA